MNEKLYTEIVQKDLEHFIALVNNRYFETSDFTEVALSLSNSLSVFCQEVDYESSTQGERLQKSNMARGA